MNPSKPPRVFHKLSILPHVSGKGHVTAVSLPGIGDCLFSSFSRAGAVGRPWRSADPARERFGQLAFFSVSPSGLSLVRILSATCLATSSRSASGTSV